VSSELHLVQPANGEVKIRPFDPGDLPYVSKTYLDCLRQESSEFRNVPPDVFQIGQQKVLARLLGSSKGVVACLPEETGAIAGWALYSSGILHFCYVKHSFRRLGVAKELLAAAGLLGKTVYCTHSTILGRHLNGFFKASQFNPYLR
jgi:hypothetical protein